MMIGIVLRHLGHWLRTGQNWEEKQLNSSKMFVFTIKGLGARTFSLATRIDKGGRRAVRNLSTSQKPQRLEIDDRCSVVLLLCPGSNQMS